VDRGDEEEEEEEEEEEDIGWSPQYCRRWRMLITSANIN